MFDFLRDQVGLDLIVFANGSGKARCVSPDHQQRVAAWLTHQAS